MPKSCLSTLRLSIQFSFSFPETAIPGFQTDFSSIVPISNLSLIQFTEGLFFSLADWKNIDEGRRRRKQIRKKCQISTLRVVFTIFSDNCNSPFPLQLLSMFFPISQREKFGWGDKRCITIKTKEDENIIRKRI